MEAFTAAGFAHVHVTERYDPDVLARARKERSRFMWPWETEPRSAATGILDDETFDWAAILDGTVRSGGHPIVVSEDDLRDANSLAADRTGIAVDQTSGKPSSGNVYLDNEEAPSKCKANKEKSKPTGCAIAAFTSSGTFIEHFNSFARSYTGNQLTEAPSVPPP